MPGKTTVGDVVVTELERVDVDTIFGVVSIHNVPIYDSLARHGGFRVIMPRGESGAVNMADAYSRITGQLGVAITSTGAGAGNAAGALIEADTAGTPLLHITGQVPAEYIDSGRGYIHECKDQFGMLKSISKKVFRVRQPEQASAILREAIQEACAAPTGPVSVEIPIDFQSRLVTVPRFSGSEHRETRPQPSDLTAAVREILKSSRPVVWIGGGVSRAGATSAIRELVDLIDAAVITSHAARGTMPENDPRCLGYFATDLDVKKVLSSADLLISVGTRFRGNETNYWEVELPNNHIGIDVDPAAVNRNYNHSMALIGDSLPILEGLVSEIRKSDVKPKVGYREEICRVRDAARARLKETMGPYREILDVIQENFPEQGIVVRDVSIHTTTWGSRLLEVNQPRQTVHPATVGIGQGLPMAIGAAASRTDAPILLLCGDGGFLVNLGELALIAEEGLSFTIVVFDDCGYGVLRNLQDAVFEGRRLGVDMVSPNFVTLAHAFGLEALRVGNVKQFRTAFGEALSSPKPWLIVVDTEKIGQPAKAFMGTPSPELYLPR